MYRLHHLGSLSDPDNLWLDYEWDDFDNTEWRPCVGHFMKAVEARGHEVVAIPPPPFNSEKTLSQLRTCWMGCGRPSPPTICCR